MTYSMVICNNNHIINLFCNVVIFVHVTTLIGRLNTMESTNNEKIIKPCLYFCNSVVTVSNEEFSQLSGFTRRELVGKSLVEIGVMIRINSQILLSNIIGRYSGYIFTKSLEAREVNISLFHDKDANESIYTFAEKANSRLDDKLVFIEQTMAGNIVGVAIYSLPDLIIVKANQKYLDFHDAPFNEEKTSIGLSIREIITGYIGGESEVITNNVIRSRKPSYLKEINFKSFESIITYWDLACTPIFENRKMKYIMLTTSEATERVLKNQRIEIQNKVIELQREQLGKQKKRLEERIVQLIDLVDNFELPVFRLSTPDMKIVDFNQKAFEIAKSLNPCITSMSEIKNESIEELFGIFKKNKNCLVFSEVLKDKKTKYLSKIKQLISGEEVYWNVVFEPIVQASGVIDGILILLIDVTAEINSNIAMEEKLKLQGEFVANISHELKTPLNVIFATAQLLNMYCDTGSFDKMRSSILKYIDSIKQNSYRLSKLINNIVDSSKLEAGFFKLNLSNNNIVNIVEEIVMSVTNYTESKGLNIIFDTDVEEKIIACDPEKIERIVLNIISNAIKFSNVGGEIFVEFKDKNEFIEISVKDNGIGIEGKYLDMIFERFKQVDKSLSRNAAGTGIGLSLVKSIVELHGGSITVESEPQKGSKFTVILPAKKVMQENMLFKSNIRDISESMQVEFSDVSL